MAVRDLYGPFVNQANTGVSHLYGSNDIAIIALTTCLIFALFGNAVQYFVGNRRQEKDFDRYVSVIKALDDLESAVDSFKGLLLAIQHWVIDRKSEDRK
jgi:hypothetical protein